MYTDHSLFGFADAASIHINRVSADVPAVLPQLPRLCYEQQQGPGGLSSSWCWLAGSCR